MCVSSLIVDVQQSFIKECRSIGDYFNSKEGNQYMKGFYKVLYIYDDVNELEFNDNRNIWCGNELEYQYDNNCWDDHCDTISEKETFWGNFINKTQVKTYGFFRDLMGNWSEENIVALGKLMLEKDIRQIDDYFLEENEDIYEKIVGFNESLKNINFYLPDSNLIDFIQKEITINDYITLTGGGKDQCLLEIELLLQMLNYKNIQKENTLIY